MPRLFFMLRIPEDGGKERKREREWKGRTGEGQCEWEKEEEKEKGNVFISPECFSVLLQSSVGSAVLSLVQSMPDTPWLSRNWLALTKCPLPKKPR